MSQITHENGVLASRASVSPDGRTLVFITGGRAQLAKLKQQPMSGGATTTLMEAPFLDSAKVSPDGKSIAVLKADSRGAPAELMLVPFEGGSPRVVATGTGIGMNSFGIAWFPDSKSIVYLRSVGGPQNLWRTNFSGRPEQQLTHFTRDAAQSPAISPDGKRIAFSRQRLEREVVLLRPRPRG